MCKKQAGQAEMERLQYVIEMLHCKLKHTLPTVEAIFRYVAGCNVVIHVLGHVNAVYSMFKSTN